MVVKSKTFETAKVVLYGSSFLMVAVLGITGLMGIGADRESAAGAVWLVAGAVGFWLPVASIALLTMAFSEPKENRSTIDIAALRMGDWVVISFSVLVAVFTIFQNWFVLSWIANGIHPNLVRETVYAVAAMSIASSAALCVYFRFSWAKNIFLILAALLFLKSEVWSQFAAFTENILVGSFMVGYKISPTLLALGSFGYLHRRLRKFPKPP
jgi:hypothetical protein